MPIDPRIPLGVQAPQIQNPLEVMSTVAQLQAMREQTEARRLAAEEAREKAKDAAAVRQILTETGGDMDKALPRLRQIAPKAALDFEQTIAQTKKEQQLTARYALEARGAGIDFGAKVAGIVVANPARAQEMRKYLQGVSAEVAPLLPQSDEPGEWQAFHQGLLSAKERMEAAQKNLDHFLKGEYQAALGGSLLAARNGAEWDTAIDTYLEFGGPKQVVDLFGGKGAFSSENVARAAQLALTPKAGEQVSHQSEWVLLPGQKEPVLAFVNPKTRQTFYQDKEITNFQRVPPPPPQGPFMWAVAPGAEGTSLQTPQEIRAAGAGQPLAPTTEAQGKAAGYAGRVTMAEPVFTDVGSSIRDMNIVSFEAQTGRALGKRPTFQSAEIQKYMQAARNFINAVLRRESGAVISPTEFAEAKAQYLPVPGDTDDALALKKANREYVFETMRREAGRAYVAPTATGQAKEGDVKPIPGHPGTEQTYKNGKWIRTK